MQGRQQKTYIDGIDFKSIFQFQSIFGAIASSFQPVRITIGLLMVLVIFAAGRMWDSTSTPLSDSWTSSESVHELEEQRMLTIAKIATAFGHSAPAGSNKWAFSDAQTYLIESWEDYVYEGNVSDADMLEYQQLYELTEQLKPRGVFESSCLHIAHHWNALIDGALDLNFSVMWKSVVAIVWEYPILVWQSGHHWFISLFGFLLIFTLCIGGGAISRMQACQFARQSQLSIDEALTYSWSQWRPAVLAVVSPAMFVAGISILLMLAGLVLFSIPIINVIGSLLYGLALIFGLCIALISIFYAVSFPMLVPAVMVEHCSGGESVQRAFSYVIARSLQYLTYLLLLVIAMVIGFVFVRLVATLTLDVTAALVGSMTLNDSLLNAGAIQPLSTPATGLAWYEQAGSAVISCWEIIVHDCMIGWVFSGFFSASTMVYLLMRRACDGQSTKEIWTEGLIPGTNIPMNDE
ncbi:MAG: hypothetical protein MK073_05145 [Phycisphaerales bacterium]|nr:hypothetical protein [Phycisphaerales bacterium]